MHVISTEKGSCVPLQLKLLSSDQDQTQLQSWRMQDALLAMLILLSAVAAITWGTAEFGTKVARLPLDIQGHWQRCGPL